MSFNLNDLIDLKYGMVLTIFDGRYSDGIVTVLTTDSEYGNMIESSFNGGDYEWASVRFPLVDAGWYPIVFTKTIEEAIPVMKAKLKELEEQDIDFTSWYRNCLKVGMMIEAEESLDQIKYLK